MRSTLIGVVLGLLISLLVGAAGPSPPDLYAQRNAGRSELPPGLAGQGLPVPHRGNPSVVTPGSVTTVAGPVVDGQQLILLVDQQKQTMASYHVQLGTGQITLRSVRQFRWDMEMDEFNGTEPVPSQIQALLQSR